MRDLDGIYDYIAYRLLEPETALKLVSRIENAVLSLETMPYRCPERKRGAYANRGYRQFFVENYMVIFRIDEVKKNSDCGYRTLLAQRVLKRYIMNDKEQQSVKAAVLYVKKS